MGRFTSKFQVLYFLIHVSLKLERKFQHAPCFPLLTSFSRVIFGVIEAFPEGLKALILK